MPRPDLIAANLAGVTSDEPTLNNAPAFDAGQLRSIERSRLRALSGPDLALADQLHAAQYQLITPTGTALSKEQYLGSIATGGLVYREFEPVSDIAVRGGAGWALLRYQARIAIEEGEHLADFTCWHLDSYELIDGRWQAVWSQATKTNP
jgi:hypothetical protein